jgi:hypothetical protein
MKYAAHVTRRNHLLDTTTNGMTPEEESFWDRYMEAQAAGSELPAPLEGWPRFNRRIRRQGLRPQCAYGCGRCGHGCGGSR